MQTRARAQKLVEKARATPHADESKALLEQGHRDPCQGGRNPGRPRCRPRAWPRHRQDAWDRGRPPPATLQDTRPPGDAPVIVSSLIDEIGSMLGVREATISSYNAFLDKLHVELGQTPSYVSTLLFDQSKSRSLVCPLEIGQPISRTACFSTAPTAPTASPLYDAIAEMIRATDEVVVREKTTRVFLVFQTDDGENASCNVAGEPGRKKITAMLEEHKKRGWQIVFLAADLGAQDHQTSASLGLGAEQTIAYGKGRTHEAFKVVAASVLIYLRSASDSVAFDLAQKAEAGDPTADPGHPISPPPSAPPGPHGLMPRARRA